MMTTIIVGINVNSLNNDNYNNNKEINNRKNSNDDDVSNTINEDEKIIITMI